MTLPKELYSNIIDFLTSLPNIETNNMQRALIDTACFDDSLKKQIGFDKPPAQFFPLLLQTVEGYGCLEDNRNPIVAILEAAKKCVGPNKRADCDKYIQELQKFLASTIIESKQSHLKREEIQIQINDLQAQLEGINKRIASLEKENNIDRQEILENAKKTRRGIEEDLTAKKQELKELEDQQKDILSSLSEFKEWQRIYWTAQNLLADLRTPHEFLLKWMYDPDDTSIVSVATYWQNDCLTKLNELQSQIGQFQHAKSFILDNLKTYPVREITRRFMLMETEQFEFYELYFHFSEFKDILFQLLLIADKRISGLKAFPQKMDGVK